MFIGRSAFLNAPIVILIRMSEKIWTKKMEAGLYIRAPLDG